MLLIISPLFLYSVNFNQFHKLISSGHLLNVIGFWREWTFAFNHLMVYAADLGKLTKTAECTYICTT